MFETIFSFKILDNAVKNWGWTFLSFGLVLGASFLFYWIVQNIIHRITKNTKTDLDDHIVKACQYPVIIYANLFAFRKIINHFLVFSGSTGSKINFLISIIIIFNTAWLVSRLLDKILEHYLIPLAMKTESDLDDILLPLLKNSQKSIMFTIATIVALSKAGYNVSAILTSFGIGGLAVALAAKDTIANIFGGIIVLTSRPFKAGERIKFQDYWAEVLEISLRSTKLQHPDFGYIISVPNSWFLTNPVINIQKSAGFLFFLDTRISITSSPEDLQKGFEIIGETVTGNERVTLMDLRFEDYSSGAFVLRAYFHVHMFAERHKARSEIRVEIQRRFFEHNIRFADTAWTEVKPAEELPPPQKPFKFTEYVKSLKKNAPDEAFHKPDPQG